MSQVWESLPLAEKNRIRRVVRVVQRESMAHVGRELERQCGILPEEGPVTVDARWLHGFAACWQSQRGVVRNVDYIFERGIAALDKESTR